MVIQPCFCFFTTCTTWNCINFNHVNSLFLSHDTIILSLSFILEIGLATYFILKGYLIELLNISFIFKNYTWTKKKSLSALFRLILQFRLLSQGLERVHLTFRQLAFLQQHLLHLAQLNHSVHVPYGRFLQKFLGGLLNIF